MANQTIQEPAQETLEKKRKAMNSREIQFQVQVRKADTSDGEGQADEEMIVEGYAVRFNSPTVLFEYDGIEYKDIIAGQRHLASVGVFE